MRYLREQRSEKAKDDALQNGPCACRRPTREWDAGWDGTHGALPPSGARPAADQQEKLVTPNMPWI
jgi:hypothetical protein